MMDAIMIMQLPGASPPRPPTMVQARDNVHFCKECQTLTDGDICPICQSSRRNHRQIMVVENSRDLAAYEKTGRYDGVYHVLHGAISPMLGIGPKIHLVAPKSITRSEGKAVRVIDKRKLHD